MKANDSGHLTEEEIKEIENFAFRTPSADYTAFRVFEEKRLMDPDAKTAAYITKSKLGGASVVHYGEDFPKMKVNGTEVSYVIEDVGISFSVPKRDVRLSKRMGMPLDSDYMMESLDSTWDEINKIAYVGDVNHGTMTGLTELSGVTAITASAVIDTGVTNVLNIISNAYYDLPIRARKKTTQYSLVVPPADEKYYNQMLNTSTTNDTWKSLIERSLPIVIEVEEEIVAGAALASGATIAAGTSWLVPKNKEFIRFPVAQSVHNVMDSNSVSNPAEDSIIGKTRARIGPVEAPYAISVGKISGLRT